MEIAQEYAADRGHDVKLELMLYIIHGCLHLCGYADTDSTSEAGCVSRNANTWRN